MPNYQAISLERHAKQRWHPVSGYAHAQYESIVPLVAAELPKAMLSLAIAFVEQAGVFVPAAVLSLLPGNNLYVAKSGKWTDDYIPSSFRAYPFGLATLENGQKVLCIDEDSGVVSDNPEGERFFNEDGTPAQAVLNILNFLNQAEQSRLGTLAACAVLQKHALIRPWPITLKTETGDHQVAGLFQIDEAALNALAEEALLEVRNSGALPIAYCQLLSMQHLPMLGQFIEAHSKAEQTQAHSLDHLAPSGDLVLEFFNKGGTFNFSKL